MSRFEDTLQRDLRQIADRATPSPDAWAQIQSRIDAEEPFQETEIIMLTENTFTKRRWPLVAAAAAVAAIAIGAIALVNRGDDIELPAAPPTPAPTVAPDAVEPDVVEPEADSAEVQTVDGAAAPLPSPGATVAAGRYTSDRMGVPLEFEVPAGDAEQWVVNIDNPLAVAIGTDAGFIAFQRIGSFYDADQAQSATFTGLGSIPPDDIDGWIGANGITVEDSADTTIDGRAAQFRRVSVPDGYGDGLCPPEVQPCVRLNSVSADLIDQNPRDGSELDGPFANAYWFVDMDDYEPLGVWAFAHDGDLDGWLDEIAPILESMVLGEPAPAVEGGTARLPLREQFFASYTTPRGEGTELADGTIERTGTFMITGDLTGEVASTGIEVTPANGYDDLVFTGTIDGIGTGTLTMYQEWTGSANGDISLTTTITDATGDFTGITGRVITAVDQPDESGPEPIYQGRMTFMLTIPVSG